MGRADARATPSPNIWHHPATYEIENRAADPDGLIEAAMASVASWDGSRFLDVGCGSGFHLPRWAASAASVVGVEPHPDLARLAQRRTRRLSNVSVSVGTAQALPVADASVDVMQARWALLLRPRLRTGAGRARPGDGARRHGVRDRQRRRPLDLRRVVPARLSRDRPGEVERFWSLRGWTRIPVDMGWSFDVARRLRGSRADRVHARGRGVDRRVARRHARSTTPSTCGGGASSASSWGS